MNNDAATTEFPDRWRHLLGQMEREWDRLHQEIAQLRVERDHLSKALVSLMREEVTLSEAEILGLIGQEKPLREFLQEMRAQLVGD